MLRDYFIKVMATQKQYGLVWRCKWCATFLLITLFAGQKVQADPEQYPLFLKAPVVPIMMLNMSRDHNLYYKAYDDFGDLTDTREFLPVNSTTPNPDYLGSKGDGEADTTYIHKYKYFGYFDNTKCYEYNLTDKRFDPKAFADSSNYCTSLWSGNFLNWATMTRIDVVRKILYGGLRSIDTSTETVLERAFLPADAHSFAKYYNGTDINKLTPFAIGTGSGQVNVGKSTIPDRGITLCNTTPTSSGNDSQSSTDAPKVRVVRGNYSLWASNEGFQCQYGSGNNGNDPDSITKQYPSKIIAYSVSPPDSDKLGTGEYTVKVKVCVPGLLEPEKQCQAYGTSFKPIGLLQTFGETKDLNFGLMTTSYQKNKSGGVLRKNVRDMLDEINMADGTFNTSIKGIIDTISRLRIYGYNSKNQQPYTTGDACPLDITSFSDGACSNWGNPQSEMYYESLRYLSGQTTPTSNYLPTTTGFLNLNQATWVAPVTAKNYCAPLSILQFNTSTSSYDDDPAGYPNLSSIGITSSTILENLTNTVGDSEGINKSSVFIGKVRGASGGINDDFCTAKYLEFFSKASGLCPESPGVSGGYLIAGLANYARKTGIPIQGTSKVGNVRTYGVDMARSVPKVEVLIPNGSGRKIVIQPACRDNNVSGNCSIVDFKVVKQYTTPTTVDYSKAGVNNSLPKIEGLSGTLYVNWEDAEQGVDYDQDLWGIIEYLVTKDEVYIRTQIIAQSASHVVGFGYIVTGVVNSDGTDASGYYVHTGINDFISTATGSTCTAQKPCKCRSNYKTSITGPCDGDPSYLKSFKISSAASGQPNFLKSPLYYAAKWGGYARELDTLSATDLEAQVKAYVPDGQTYFYATDPKQLEKQLSTAFKNISKDIGSASGVATNSSYLNDGTFLFATEFNTFGWVGEVKAYEFKSDGSLKLDGSGKLNVVATTKTKMPTTGLTRSVYTSDGNAIPTTVQFSTSLSGLNGLLGATGDAVADPTYAVRRADWLLGNATYEDANGGMRSRTENGVRNILGDIVNSSPVYVGAYNYHYNRLAEGGALYDEYVKKKQSRKAMLYVGANDGMLHAFSADTADLLTEQYAYIPRMILPKLVDLTKPNYGKTANEHKYFVDGPVVAGDVYFSSSKSWRTIIVGTLGAGGKGVYAVDVSNPLIPTVLFELTDKNLPGLGFVMGRPIIAPMANGRFAVVFGNGDSTGTTSKLFIVDVEDPFGLTKTINTTVGTGLSSPALLPNKLGQATAAYAGDLNGNLWRFDLSSSKPDDWKKYYLLFQAKYTVNGVDKVQPIFAAPTLGINLQKEGKIMVYFGTGKYYDTADNTSTDQPLHSFYAIADIGTSTTPTTTTALVTRDSLKQKTWVYTNGGVNREVNEADFKLGDWSNNNGWYLNLDTGGERVITTAILIEDKLVFPTMSPSSDVCAKGGSSWLMEVVAVGDKYVGVKLLDAIKRTTNEVIGPLGFGLTEDGKGKAVGTDVTGDVVNKTLNTDDKILGRQSWRQLR